MRATNGRKWNVLVAAVVLAAAGCTGDSLDDGDSADVVLEVFSIPQIPPITTAVSGAGCTFIVTSVNVTLRNQATNDVVASPFGDIRLETVTLSYDWFTLPATPTRTLSIGGTIPVGGSGSVSFPPILLQDLSTGYAGATASVDMLFRGRTVAGQDVQASARGSALSVSSCACPDDDADGLCNNIDSCPGCNNVACTGSGWCAVVGNTCSNPNPTCP